MSSQVIDRTRFVYGQTNMCKAIYPHFFKELEMWDYNMDDTQNNESVLLHLLPYVATTKNYQNKNSILSKLLKM